VTLNYGLFIISVISFLLVALVVFGLVRVVNRLYPEPSAPVTTKQCPFCYSIIPLAAIRCPHCTSLLTEQGP